MTKRVISPFRLATIQALATWTSAVTNCLQYDGMSYLISWADNTGTGHFVVEASTFDDKVGEVASWAILEDLDNIPVSGATGTNLININAIMFERIRIRYVADTASTGTFSINVCSKTIGA